MANPSVRVSRSPISSPGSIRWWAFSPRYRANSDRLKNREELIARLSALTVRWSRADLLAKLEAVGVPAGPINALDQVFSDPQVVHRGMRIDPPSAAAKAGTIPGVRTPIIIGGRPMASERPS